MVATSPALTALMVGLHLHCRIQVIDLLAYFTSSLEFG